MAGLEGIYDKTLSRTHTIPHPLHSDSQVFHHKASLLEYKPQYPNTCVKYRMNK